MSLTNTDRRKTDYFAKFPWPRVMAPAIDFSMPVDKRADDAAAQERTAAISMSVNAEGVAVSPIRCTSKYSSPCRHSP